MFHYYSSSEKMRDYEKFKENLFEGHRTVASKQRHEGKARTDYGW
jgi:hypothetical protein